jgi:hypothetical protein
MSMTRRTALLALFVLATSGPAAEARVGRTSSEDCPDDSTDPDCQDPSAPPAKKDKKPAPAAK